MSKHHMSIFNNEQNCIKAILELHNDLTQRHFRKTHTYFWIFKKLKGGE